MFVGVTCFFNLFVSMYVVLNLFVSLSEVVIHLHSAEAKYQMHLVNPDI